jgi:hypothetical protein
MIEALFLVMELLVVILLMRKIKSISKSNDVSNLGIFCYKDSIKKVASNDLKNRRNNNA